MFEFLSKDGNITPEKVRKSRQMQFRDKTAYVWGLRYRWDPSLSRIPDPRIPHFMPPCHLIMADFTLNIAALLWELHWTFKATHIVAFFAFFSAAAFAELKCALLKRFLRVQIISILFLDTLQGSSTHRTSSYHGYDHNSCNLHFETKTIPLIPSVVLPKHWTLQEFWHSY